jgi:hypothetical protein
MALEHNVVAVPALQETPAPQIRVEPKALPPSKIQGKYSNPYHYL